jgi:hypothetical protein
MTETTLDRVPVSQAQASSGLSRSSFYKRLQHAGVVPLKVGVSSFLTQPDLERLADCERWVQAGQKPEDFLASIGEQAPASAGAAAGQIVSHMRAMPVALGHPQQLPLLDEPDQESPEDLVAAEVEHLDRLLSFLTKAARLSWQLPTSRVELLVGARPRGASLERYGFRFSQVGRHGQESAWRVERI